MRNVDKLLNHFEKFRVFHIFRVMRHKSMELPGVILSDPYFTEEQWKLVVNEKHSLLDEVMKKRSLLEEVKRFLGDHDEEKKEKKEELGSRLEELISHL